jgi:hypothetical protein
VVNIGVEERNNWIAKCSFLSGSNRDAGSHSTIAIFSGVVTLPSKGKRQKTVSTTKTLNLRLGNEWNNERNNCIWVGVWFSAMPTVRGSCRVMSRQLFLLGRQMADSNLKQGRQQTRNKARTSSGSKARERTILAQETK